VRRSWDRMQPLQAGLEKLVCDTHPDEVIVVTETYEHCDRVDSYRRVAHIAAQVLATGDADAG
jgi:hypothetical protein